MIYGMRKGVYGEVRFTGRGLDTTVGNCAINKVVINSDVITSFLTIGAVCSRLAERPRIYRECKVVLEPTHVTCM